MDEIDIQTTTNKPPRILSVCGKKLVGIILSAESGTLNTVICCCNTVGAFIPPFLIFVRKLMQDRLLDDAPPEAQATCTGNGLSNGGAFLQWLHFFVEHVCPNNKKKILPLLVNHESHKYYPALQFAT
ncbi:hypothetical protein PR048_022096 [Dryococelus australis]|uniref:DDE-1 domain-containing protein n=1 Tax=Dryococelus australis TaxID=614101 RepID=A0ABQ9H0A7_9NEOP|nr:hypothetical protein PR048_022096 [Dryococelus australis]